MSNENNNYDNDSDKRQELIKIFLDDVERKLPFWLKDEKENISDILEELETHIWDRATELAEVRKLIKFLYNVELAIERVVLRLETVRELSDIVIDLKPALKMLGGISRNLFNLMPDISSEIKQVVGIVFNSSNFIQEVLTPKINQISSEKFTCEKALNLV